MSRSICDCSALTAEIPAGSAVSCTLVARGACALQSDDSRYVRDPHPSNAEIRLAPHLKAMEARPQLDMRQSVIADGFTVRLLLALTQHFSLIHQHASDCLSNANACAEFPPFLLSLLAWISTQFASLGLLRLPCVVVLWLHTSEYRPVEMVSDQLRRSFLLPPAKRTAPSLVQGLPRASL